VSPPDYVCGDNPTSTCSAPNAPDTSQPNAAPQLSGPPTADDCRSYEIFYAGSICKQVLGVTSPSPATSALPGATASPVGTTPVATAQPTVPPAIGSAPVLTPLPGIDAGGLATAIVVVWGFAVAASVFLVASTWKVFTKAGEPGWAGIVPIYNSIVYLKIAGKPWWWIFITWLIVPVFIVNSDLAKAFGKPSGFGIGLTLLPFVFLPILAFGDAQYRHPDVGPRPRAL
jgi:hypothetical protein